MKEITILFVFSTIIHLHSLGQAVTIDPEHTDGNTEITITFDVSQAKNPLSKGLLGVRNNVYLWAGAGISETGDPFKFQPLDQHDFTKPYNNGTMQYLGKDKWSIKLVPRKYFSVPDSFQIKRLGLLLKNKNGKSQTEDFIISF